MVGVINKVKFIRNGSSKFKNFIDYIDRSEATRKKNFDKYSAYNNYMGNPEKIGSLFTKDKHSLTEKEVKKLKKKILIKLNRMVVICGKKFLVLIMNF